MVDIKVQGNVSVKYENGKKVVFFPSGTSWKNPTLNGENGCFIVPNKDIMVLDIDDLSIEHNKYIWEKFNNKCGYIVKTAKKGYHMYFNYCPELSNMFKGALPSLDIVHSEKMMLFCPPTRIYDDEIGTDREYKLIKNDGLFDIPNELSNYIITTKSKLQNEKTNLLIESDKVIKRLTSKQEDKKLIKEFSNIKKDDKIINQILTSINKDRADDYNEWFKVLMICKNENIDYETFENFSRRSSKFDSKVEDIWNRYKPNDVKNKLTIATLWQMLKNDNPDAFQRIKSDETFKDYKYITIGNNGDFSTTEFIKMFNEDKRLLGSKLIDEDILAHTNSFKYFNNHHAKIMSVGCFFRIDYEGGLKKITKLPNNFKEQLNNAYITNGDKEHTFLSLYDKNKHQKVYDAIEFEPGVNKNNVLNYFSGFKYQEDNDPINMKIIEPFIDFVKYVINNEKQADHFFKWLAYIIQNPGKKQPQCYVFYSFTHGIGKNTIVTAITNIFKGYYYKLKDADQMADKFNSEALGKLFCYGDEIKTFKGGESLSNIVKNLISQTECSIELKGKDKIMVKDCCNYLFTTNNENNFQIEQTDRRFNMVECNTKKLDPEIYIKINNLIITDIFGANFYKFLKGLDLKDYNPQMALISEYKNRMQINSLPLDIKTFYKIYKNKDNVSYISSIYEDIQHEMSPKKPRSQNVIFKSLKEVYGFKLTRGYDEDGNRDTKLSIAFDDSKTGKHNKEMIKKLHYEDKEELTEDDEIEYN